jgi:endonuclease/exonuclease/phosphatase family metal-dependent hydrolase
MVRVVMLLLAHWSCALQAETPFRVLTYNVLHGFNHGESRDTGADWIAARKPDLVALQELNGYTQESLEALADGWGHDHAVILKETGFPVGLTSNAPIEIIEKRLEGMWHGYLHCKVRGVHVFVVHLSPSKFAVRMREAGIICPKARRLLDAGERVLILGDFNCSSPLDHQWLQTRPKPEETDTKSAARRAANADPKSAVMSQFLACGLVDLVHKNQHPDELERGTFPTRLLPHAKTDQQRKDKVWRIDFILTDPVLAKQCTGASIPRDNQTDLISDHYPVQAEFNPF